MSNISHKTRPTSRLNRLRTNRFVQLPVHTARRRLGQADVRRLLASSLSDAERRVVEAIGAALRSAPDLLTLAQIEECRTRYRSSQYRFPGADRGKTSTLAGAVSVSRPQRGARLLYELVRACNPDYALELGTCVGISTAYQAAAMRSPGRLVTIEKYADLAKQANETLSRSGVAERVDVVVGDIDEVLEPVLASLPRVDYAFVDANHQHEATVAYARQILAKTPVDAVLVFDDIDWSVGMRRAWQEVATMPAFSLVLDLRSVGIVVVGHDKAAPRRERIHYA